MLIIKVMKKIITIVTAVFLALSGYAQQDAVYNHYMFNELLINPAYAGTKGLLNANAIYIVIAKSASTMASSVLFLNSCPTEGPIY